MTREEKQQVTDWRNRFATELRRLNETMGGEPYSEDFINGSIASYTDKIILEKLKCGIPPESCAYGEFM